MHLSRLTDALRRARASRDGQTRDVWVREAWLAFWRVDARAWYAAEAKHEAASARYANTGTVRDGYDAVTSLRGLLLLLPPYRALASLQAWRWRTLPSTCAVAGCDRIAVFSRACPRCDAFLRGSTGDDAPLWWVLVPALEDAFQAGRAELWAAEAAAGE